MTDETRSTRRAFTKALSGTALLATAPLAGCTGGGGDGGDGGNDATTTEESGGGSDDSGGDSGGSSGGDFGGWLDDVDNYDGVEDRTGSDTTTVIVGSQANGGAYGYSPAAMKISTGTTVEFEWTGEGASHNVVDQDGAFESDLLMEAGVHFEHTFSEAGTFKYYCSPHKSLGMKGVIVVE